MLAVGHSPRKISAILIRAEQTQCVLPATTKPIVRGQFAHALQVIQGMLSPAVLGESAKVTVNARITKLALITSASILAVDSVEQEHNVKLKDI